MHSSVLLTIVLLASAVILTVVSGNKDDAAKVTFDEEKRGGWDKTNKGFNDYSHLRFGRADPMLSEDLPPFYRYPSYAPISNYAEKRASFGSDYNHLRFGRRVPSFTDYGHLRFG
jgi:hypothetical protein